MNRANERSETRAARVVEFVVDRVRLRVVEVVVIKLERADEVRLRSELVETVKHERAAATPISSDFEPRTMRGERIRPHGPGYSRP